MPAEDAAPVDKKDKKKSPRKSEDLSEDSAASTSSTRSSRSSIRGRVTKALSFRSKSRSKSKDRSIAAESPVDAGGAPVAAAADGNPEGVSPPKPAEVSLAPAATKDTPVGDDSPTEVTPSPSSSISDSSNAAPAGAMEAPGAPTANAVREAHAAALEKEAKLPPMPLAESGEWWAGPASCFAISLRKMMCLPVDVH
jgi:hypothetical protein